MLCCWYHCLSLSLVNIDDDVVVVVAAVDGVYVGCVVDVIVVVLVWYNLMVFLTTGESKRVG